MCGICGIYDFGNNTPRFDESLLVGMSEAIAHRGPDDTGTFISRDRRAGFGFRRLSIVDLSPAGHQPMSAPDEKATIVFNGEIYNHLVLRSEFEARGYRYRSRSDTETILYAYLEYGPDFLHKLLGMFAIALWDEEKKLLLLARDRIGVKPLYYALTHGQLVFGSEIKALLKHPDVPRQMNEEAFYHYLTFMVTPCPMTMFAGIQKLGPGERLIVRNDGTVQKDRWWDLIPNESQQTIDLDGSPAASSQFLARGRDASEEEHAEIVRTLLQRSVKDRMMSDVPFGVFLSGGIDSSTNVALMAGEMDRPVDTFSVGFRDLEKYNELQHARDVAKVFSTNHHEVIIGQKEALEFLPDLVHHQDEPLADPVCIPLYFVSKLARENGTIVVQIGEGSDELFAGYQWMQRELRFYRSLWAMYTSLPDFVRKAAYGSARAVLAPLRKFLILDYIRKGTEREELFWGGAISLTETHKESLLNGWNDRALYDTHTLARDWHGDILARQPDADYLKRMIYLEFRNRLPELLLMRVDKITMAASVEGRDPFLDHRLVEYALTIPSSLKIRNGQSKYILKKAVKNLIPDRIIQRKKQGFAAPVNEWMRNEWSGFLRGQLLDSSLVRDGYFRKTFIERMIDDHRIGKRNNGQPLWSLLNLVLWHNHWIGKSHA